MAAAQMGAAIRSHGETTTLVAASLYNTSKQPVYDIAIRWSISGAPLGGPHVGPYLMPGKDLLCTQSWTPSAGITGLAVELDVVRQLAGYYRWVAGLCGMQLMRYHSSIVFER